ncbi:hypothetical protein BN2476_540018 [Paraburkholderia piptadeniae]|uniref:Uncharacterized protein n=1 Tax=Paraburkholderia piptadeniae TaxID=1701573 RepID=A0A1N7SJ41_9BURK|nr:hypothetical protein BN2476_540018 [Paraburkholderia piptadeniae]
MPVPAHWHATHTARRACATKPDANGRDAPAYAHTWTQAPPREREAATSDRERARMRYAPMALNRMHEG